MRILLASNASYAPPRGGSTRCNLVWLRHLASRGHACRVVCQSLAPAPETTTAEGVAILSVPDLARHVEVLGEEIRAFLPDWVLVSSEDVGHVLLREAGHSAPGRLIYLAHTPQFFPFGPASWHQDQRATEIVRRARAIVAIGRHMAEYVQTHCGRPAHVIHPPIYGAPPYARYGSNGSGDILMINPCEVKGIHIFAGLARRFPRYPFAALTGWGTTARDRGTLAAIPNVRLLESVPNIEDVLSSSRLLLMPSLWYEGFGLIAMEAMLRGIPVISSDSGGLTEAKQDTGFVIPVRPIERYEASFDENHMPKPVAVEQDIEPWAEALSALLTNKDLYQAESDRSRQAALAFVTALRVEAFEEMLLSLTAPPLKILLAHNSLYYPSHGGGDRSNRLLMEALARLGHRVQVVARNAKQEDEQFNCNGVEVHSFTRNSPLRAQFSSRISEFDPDVILTSTDDPAQLLFDIAARAPRARLVHLVRATIAVPFGPDSSSPSHERAALLSSAGAIVGVSEYVARYVRQFGGLEAVHVPISLMDTGDPPLLGSFDNPFVMLVNPCAVKGISIFLELADRMPNVPFAAVPTWGTNAQDLAALRARPNITILAASDDVDDILRQARVLLVPSVWAEARSRIVVEAMARGIPVIASDVGGIPEAKLGVDYLVPVTPVAHYQPAVDENMVPVAEVPPQNIEPWVRALDGLLADRAHYSRLAQASRSAALAYLARLSVHPFESLLQQVAGLPKQPPPPVLSPDRQRLFTLLLKKKLAARAADPWFPYLEPCAGRLFCFPYAGAGALAWPGWKEALHPEISFCPVRLPGRESRGSEACIDRMDILIDALAAAITPHLAVPFVFFGHSMGAAIAFELARALRARGAALPRALIVSAARAPVFRIAHRPGPEPDDAGLIAQVRRLEGIPAGVLDDPELLRIALPALRADARLYRNYTFVPGEPLPVPLIAYYGISDPDISLEHIGRWSDLTSRSFTRREFPGGHFFIQTARDEFLRTLRRDLASVAGRQS